MTAAERAQIRDEITRLEAKLADAQARADQGRITAVSDELKRLQERLDGDQEADRGEAISS